MADNIYDTTVIGRAAKELGEKGLKTIMLERGMGIVHIEDYKEAWDYPHRGDRTQEMIRN